MDQSIRDITTLLGEARDNPQAMDDLYRRVEARFHRMAAGFFQNERASHTLQTTILVDDAFRQLVCEGQPYQWENRDQFFAAAAKLMRRLLVDHARQRTAARRGGSSKPAQLDAVAEPTSHAPDPVQIVAIDEALQRVETQHPGVFEVFELHYFMGIQLKEIATDVLDVSYSTVKRRWELAKVLLHRELAGERS